MKFHQAELNLSDGIGYASFKVPKDIITELWAFNNQIFKHAIIVITPNLLRFSNNEGKTVFVLKEPPRLIIQDVAQKIIGSPEPIMKAFDSQKYDLQKYSEDHFKIEYTQKFTDFINHSKIEGKKYFETKQ